MVVQQDLFMAPFCHVDCVDQYVSICVGVSIRVQPGHNSTDLLFVLTSLPAAVISRPLSDFCSGAALLNDTLCGC